jgi:erythromycin esterase-like protein
MTKDIRDLLPPTTELLALGEPGHWEPAFGWVRNELFARLVELGFRSIAMETHRVAALTVDDFVRDGIGTLDAAMAAVSHDFGEMDANRALVTWMREYNERRPPAERLSFQGIDIETENTNAPSPRAYLEHARDYLGMDVDIAGIAGDDERWSRTEAIMDHTMSPGATAGAQQLREIGEGMLAALDERAPEPAGKRARIHLTAGLGLLRYHKEAARPGARDTLMVRLLATRDAIMAQNLLDLGDRPALVFAHNVHLQKSPSSLRSMGMAADWVGAGAVAAALLGDRYTFIAGSLGSSDAYGLGEPAPDTYEGALQSRISGWGLTTDLPTGVTRTDVGQRRGYAPLDDRPLAGADAVLHISSGVAVAPTRA